MIQETAAQNIKNQLKPSIWEREDKNNSKVNQCMDNATVTLEDHQ